jgi:hypothetical protein
LENFFKKEKKSGKYPDFPDKKRKNSEFRRILDENVGKNPEKLKIDFLP